MRSEFDLIDHALRGPLNIALLNLELLGPAVRGDASAEQSIRRIREEILRLSHALLPATFDILSLEGNEKKSLNSKSLVERALTEHELSGVIVTSGHWPDVVGDESLLGLAIAHLGRNALTATPPSGPPPQISAETRGDGGVDIVVRDWGTGFGKERVPSRPYVTRRGHLGGVTAVVRIARLHGATLAFESPEVGAVVRFSLPPSPPAA